MWEIPFITEEDFQLNIENAVKEYFNAIKSVDLVKFNSNLIDPIKLIFDMKIYNKSPETLIEDEINRQIDRTNSNTIGYFNQNMFKYIKNCEVPKQGFDVIYTNPNNGEKIYVEMKNKHNTMNNDSSNNVYNKMLNKLRDEPDATCYLVEIIAKKSQNKIWNIHGNTNERIRRVSIDKFYYEVTGIKNAFKMICDNLPKQLDIVIKKIMRDENQENIVFNQFKKIDSDIIKSMFLLVFSTYEGFKEE